MFLKMRDEHYLEHHQQRQKNHIKTIFSYAFPFAFEPDRIPMKMSNVISNQLKSVDRNVGQLESTFSIGISNAQFIR